MKKLALVILVLQLCVSACKKDSVDPVDPNDAATVVEGTYTMTQTSQNGTVVNLPANGVSGQISFTRIAVNQSTMRFLITAGNTTSSDQRIPVYLGGTGGTVDIYADPNKSTKIGTATKNSVKLSVVSNGTTATIDGSR